MHVVTSIACYVLRRFFISKFVNSIGSFLQRAELKICDKMEVKDLETEDTMLYRFYPVQTQALKFKVKAPHDAHIALTSGPAEANPMYEVFIGGWENTKIAIRRNREKPEVAEHSYPDILNGGEFKSFWLTFYNKVIALGINEENTPIITWSDPDMFLVTHFGIRTSWGARGVWSIDDTWGGWRAPENPGIGWTVGSQSAGRGTWVGAANGAVPPNAVHAGFDNEQQYIGRAMFSGGLLPGKVVPSHQVCYVPWGGGEHGVPEYEVLCDCGGTWLKTSGAEVPPTAIPGGKTEDGETLYIGRAEHNGVMATGKVQRSHGVCYIPYAGQEIGKPDYEILVESQ